MSKKIKVKVVDAVKPLTFNVTAVHHAYAKCKDPSNCVIAQAVKDSNIGEFGLENIFVGATITKIRLGDRVIRYRTPAKLRAALIEFDNTGKEITQKDGTKAIVGGKWNIFGEVHLTPLTAIDRLGARSSRWKKKPVKKTGRPRVNFKARAVRSRQVSRIESVAAAKL